MITINSISIINDDDDKKKNRNYFMLLWSSVKALVRRWTVSLLGQLPFLSSHTLGPLGTHLNYPGARSQRARDSPYTQEPMKIFNQAIPQGAWEPS